MNSVLNILKTYISTTSFLILTGIIYILTLDNALANQMLDSVLPVNGRALVFFDILGLIVIYEIFLNQFCHIPIQFYYNYGFYKVILPPFNLIFNFFFRGLASIFYKFSFSFSFTPAVCGLLFNNNWFVESSFLSLFELFNLLVFNFNLFKPYDEF